MILLLERYGLRGRHRIIKDKYGKIQWLAVNDKKTPHTPSHWEKILPYLREGILHVGENEVQT